ncbi:MAG: PQQ-dependent sugar dehydrogenase [Cellvibrionaceae bacterium]
MIWFMRFIKGILALWAVAVVAVVALVSFGPISSPEAIFNVVFGTVIDAPNKNKMQSRFELPEGFSIGQYATGLKKVRMLEFTRRGDLIASQPRDGKVLLLKADDNQDGRSDDTLVLMEQLKRPHGLELHGDWLYIAESHAIGRIKFNHDTGTVEGTYSQIITGLTDDGNHWSKSIRIKDDYLYVSMGSTCNVCEEADKRRATIMRFDLDGNNAMVYAEGLRNSVGLDFAPWDGSLYATDNGRDLLGDDYPVCELNKIEQGAFYGWPYINGFGDLDPDFGEGQEALLETSRSPAFGFAAHNAPLGLRFIRNSKMPKGYEKSALAALHGSWNRSQADGYKVVSLHWQEDGSIIGKDFLSGFELNGDVIGRPVDIAEGPDGCLFVSDDYAGTVYRVCYGESQSTLSEQTSTAIDTHWATLSDDEKQTLSAEGKQLYQANGCRNCHLHNRNGNASGKLLANLSPRYSFESLTEYFLSPNPPMPQFSLTLNERQALSAFLLSTAP